MTDDGEQTAVCRNERRCSCDLARLFWARAARVRAKGSEKHNVELFWVGFNLNQLRTFQHTPLGGPLRNGFVTVLRDRHPYIRPDGTPGESPSHDSYLFYSGVNSSAFMALSRALGELA
jgi:hypothetical protein